MAIIDNLVSYWKMDETSENALDAHSTNTLIDNNTVTSAGGKISTARQFTLANTEFFSLADNAAMSVSDVNFAFACWLYLDTKTASQAHISKDLSGSREYLLNYSVGVDRFVWSIFDSGATAYVATANTFGSPSTATWYWLFMYHDATANEVGISVNNGAFNTTTTAGAAPINGTAAFQIGAREFVGSRIPTDGRIDEVAFWKNGFPTSGERTSLYNGGAGLAYPFTTARSPRRMLAGMGA